MAAPRGEHPRNSTHVPMQGEPQPKVIVRGGAARRIAHRGAAKMGEPQDGTRTNQAEMLSEQYRIVEFLGTDLVQKLAARIDPAPVRIGGRRSGSATKASAMPLAQPGSTGSSAFTTANRS